MNGHPQFEEDFDLYAMGTMEAEEKQAFASHLEACPGCTARLEEARGRMAMLALAAPQTDVPAAVKDRLMRQIRAEAPKVQTKDSPAFWRWLAPSFAVATLALLVIAVRLNSENRRLAAQQAELQSEVQQAQQEAAHEHAVLDLLTAPDSVRVTLVAGSARAVPEGRAFYHPRKGLLFYASNLPALPSERTYQLWIVPAQGNPISAGVFQVDAGGNGQVTLPQIPANVAAKAFAVTVEPSGGVSQPTGPKVLVGVVS